jgi:hypothetical protein
VYWYLQFNAHQRTTSPPSDPFARSRLIHITTHPSLPHMPTALPRTQSPLHREVQSPPQPPAFPPNAAHPNATLRRHHRHDHAHVCATPRLPISSAILAQDADQAVCLRWRGTVAGGRERTGTRPARDGPRTRAAREQRRVEAIRGGRRMRVARWSHGRRSTYRYCKPACGVSWGLRDDRKRTHPAREVK